MIACYVIIGIITVVVLGACLILWPIRIIIDRSKSKQDLADRKLREQAQLVMLKSGRLV
jgi:hypothetical protein